MGWTVFWVYLVIDGSVAGLAGWEVLCLLCRSRAGYPDIVSSFVMLFWLMYSFPSLPF